MAVPIITALKMWAGTLFTKDDWDFNFSQIVSWLADGNADLVVNTIKTTNGIDLDGAQISNLGAATTGSQAITLDQANTILNRSSYYYPFSVASGKVDSNGDAAYIQKDSDTQVTVLAGNVNPDLVCILSDGTIESVTSNTVLTVPVSDGTYHIIKEKEEAITITAGSSGKVTVGKAYPSTPNIGDYFCDNSVTPFKGYKYTTNGWEDCAFCWLGDVSVTSGTATVNQFSYNDNFYDVNRNNQSVIVKTYVNGYSWYREYSDGWVEQGGRRGLTGATTTVSLLITMADANYTPLVNFIKTSDASSTYYNTITTSISTSSFKVYESQSGSSTTYKYVSWYVCGYKA